MSMMTNDCTPKPRLGGIGGGILQMEGWTWAAAPNARDTSGESGKIVFEILVDARGDVIRIKKISSEGLSPATERVYVDALELTSFVRTNNEPASAQNQGATGLVTFIVRPR